MTSTAAQIEADLADAQNAGEAFILRALLAAARRREAGPSFADRVCAARAEG
jgi:hypothetical protein